MVASKKSNTRSVTCLVFPERKIIYALGYVPNSVQDMAPKQINRPGRKGKDTENFQEDTGKGDHASNCS